ncbi:MAG: DUF3048 domain-containing protein [Firmicutes bacterium]|nr:DUF3048 domain-containing protein [Bacillota bacterium]
MSKQKKKKGKALPIVAIIMAIAVVGTGAFAVTTFTGCSGEGGSPLSSEPEPIINPITGIESETELFPRPVMVSVPNDTYGAVPQSNLTQADIIYEFPVEGDLTRLQAVYLTERPDEFGPTRSVRYYFVDLAREYQAAHIGYGWGKHAHSYMYSSGLPYINGMQETDLFYRNSKKSAPNNAYIKWENIEKYAEENGWWDKNTSKDLKPFKFRDDEWKAEIEEAKATVEKLQGTEDPEEQKELAKAEALVAEPQKASSVKVSSAGCNSECKYNEETGLYDRFWYGEPYVDLETGKQLSFSNILVQEVKSTIMYDPETGEADAKNRLEIDMNSSGEAYLFTNGEVVKGTWSKKSAEARTIFKDEAGNQFRMTPGKTWVYVIDQNKKFEFE